MLALRVPVAVVSGVLFSLAVFLGLWQLVGGPLDVQPLVEASDITFTRQIIETPVETRRVEKIVRERPVLKPTGPKIITDGGDIGGTTFTRPPVTRIERTGGINLHGVDGDAIPIVRPNPDYPARALTAGTEGWVQVQFAVTAVGGVRDAIVVDSEPGTVFDEAALKAVARWRYNPRIDRGVAVERVGLQAIIRFELEN